MEGLSGQSLRHLGPRAARLKSRSSRGSGSVPSETIRAGRAPPKSAGEGARATFALFCFLSLVFFLFWFSWERLFDWLAREHLVAHGGVVDEAGDDD